ncbi:hypothetical protein C9F11_37455 [Streptomyces sp. YIM 121038]|uniref:hypothetical protein n=1 Tax=Streptomyces sp. YIM 121038 TaxID=2136401 RepID=UPI001110C728|nr:hypothetical protein [Streptomyces sp. YIM 121038]QCX81074.1 hypothetical protein C9F11_37455 [Streptomyces sp. YIM 121038]
MFRFVRTTTLDALRSDAATARAEAERHCAAAEAVAREHHAEADKLRGALAGAEGELVALRAQTHLDAEDRVALRMLLRSARRQSSLPDRVFVLFQRGALHSIHTTLDGAEAAAEAEGATPSGWTSLTAGAALPPASEVAWRVQPLPLSTA